METIRFSGLTHFLNVVSGFVIAIFIFPVAGKEYAGIFKGLLLGSLHGGSFIANWLYSFVHDARLLKAANHDLWYSVGWWFALVALVNSILVVVYRMFKG